jgi:hypothetical protein
MVLRKKGGGVGTKYGFKGKRGDGLQCWVEENGLLLACAISAIEVDRLEVKILVN